MYNMHSAQGGGPNVRYLQCPRGGVPMYDMYSAQRGGSQCTICTVPKGGGVPMYHMYTAQGGGGPNVRYVQCPRGGVPMYDMYSAQRGGSQCTICTVPKGGGVSMYNMYSAQRASAGPRKHTLHCHNHHPNENLLQFVHTLTSEKKYTTCNIHARPAVEGTPWEHCRHLPFLCCLC